MSTDTEPNYSYDPDEDDGPSDAWVAAHPDEPYPPYPLPFIPLKDSDNDHRFDEAGTDGYEL